MTKRGWPCIVVAVLPCLLAVAASASAERAWVLWEKQEHEHFPENRSATFWEILGARKSQPECETVLTRVWKANIKFWKDRKAGGELTSAPGYFSVTYDEASYSHHFYCLPDSVDPRGPTGK